MLVSDICNTLTDSEWVTDLISGSDKSTPYCNTVDSTQFCEATKQVVVTTIVIETTTFCPFENSTATYTPSPTPIGGNVTTTVLPTGTSNVTVVVPTTTGDEPPAYTGGATSTDARAGTLIGGILVGIFGIFLV